MDPMVQEWLTLLELTTEYMTAAEELILGLQGHLDADTRDGALLEGKRRIDRYTVAKVKLVEHARSREAMLSA
jgi:hypothetical protein